MVVIDSRGQAGLVHFPPRRRSGVDGTLLGTSDGVGRPSVRLDGSVSALAAWDDRVYVLFERGGQGARPVGSLSVVRTSMREQWRFEPGDRLRVEPALTGEGEVEAFAAGAFGPGALIVDGRAAVAETRRLYVLDGGAWRRADLPKELADGRRGEPAFLLGAGEGLGLLRRERSGAVEFWLAARIPEPARAPPGAGDPDERLFGGGLRAGAPEPAHLGLRWDRRVLCADGSMPELGGADARVFMSAGRVFAALAVPDGGVEALELTEATVVRVARMDHVGLSVGLVGMDKPARLVAVWEARAEAGSDAGDGAASGGSKREVREVSLVDGRVEYAGPLVVNPPLSAREFQGLALGLVILMGAVLLVVVRSDPSGDVYTIPPGAALASPGRRLIAGVIDLAAAGLIAARFLGVSGAELTDPSFLISSQAVGFAGLVIGVGLALGVLGEALTGRSVGKLVTGCVVVDVRAVERPSGPRFWQAVVRNLVKWVLSPAAMLGLMESQGRHRGDSLARTAVVILLEDDAEQSPEG